MVFYGLDEHSQPRVKLRTQDLSLFENTHDTQFLNIHDTQFFKYT